MSNVVSLRARRCEQVSASLPPHLIEEADLDPTHRRIIELQSRAKQEILRSIFLLELAALHARQIAKRTNGSSSNSSLSAQVTIVEQLLQIARDMALKL